MFGVILSTTVSRARDADPTVQKGHEPCRSDRFDFDLAGDPAVGSGGQILDFTTGLDRIDLSTLDAKTGTKKNDEFQFIGDAAFTGVADQLRYEIVDLAGTAGVCTKITGDLNGDRVADFEIILIGNTAALHSTDFIL